jgi:hypothetical protein
VTRRDRIKGAATDNPLMADPTVERSFDEPALSLTCRCGWEGHDVDVEDWDVQSERDRVVACCPSCGGPVPEWGALVPIDGASRVARGPLKETLRNADRPDS